MILGIDEVGRGPWAGPLVVGAVVLGNTTIDGLTDSKKLSKPKREALSALIMKSAAATGLGWVDADEIDQLGLSESLRTATRRAVEQVCAPYHEIIIDGTVNFLAGTGKGEYVTTMKKADLLIQSVSAASIIAKVARDDYMSLQDERYPGYGFGSHVGYGTAAHRAALERLGITPLHRRSFAPISKMVGAVMEHKPSSATTKSIGNAAESTAALWLEQHGYRVRERNWKTRFCEIDIIAENSDGLHFIEVKHRATTDQGGGLAAITPAKLRQMRFAASLYLTKYPGTDARLYVLPTSGSVKIEIGELLPLD